MKKKCFRTLLIVFCMALMIGFSGTAMAGKKEEGYIWRDKIGSFFSCEWFYVKDSVPEDLLHQCETDTLLYHPDKGLEEKGEKINVKFLSGSKHLKEAIKIRSDEKERKYFYVDNDVLTEPGEAVFSLSAESEHLRWSDNYYLKVIDYNEYPLLEVKTNQPVLEVSVGDRFDDDKLSEDLLAAIADVHLCEIHEKLKDQIPSKYRLYDLENDDPLFMYNPADHGTILGASPGSRPFIYWHYINYTSSYEIVDYGVYRGKDTRYTWGNVELKVPQITIQTKVGISGKEKVRPGEEASYQIDRANSKLSWSIECENAKIYSREGAYRIEKLSSNEKDEMIGTAGSKDDYISSNGDYLTTSGNNIEGIKSFIGEIKSSIYGIDTRKIVLSIDKDVDYGSEITITATDEQGNQFSKIVTVGSMFDEKDLVRVDAPEKNDGFSFSYPRKGFYNDGSNENCRWDVSIDRASKSIYGALYEDPDRARTYLEEMNEGNEKIDNFKHKWIAIEDHPAYIGIYSAEDSTWGYLLYVRNSSVFQLILSSIDSDNPVEFYDFETLAKHISYDETAAPFTVADAKLSITAKGDPKTVTAGRNLTFNYTFANPEKVSKKNKNDTVVWSVSNADTGESVEGVSIDARGQLKVDKKLAAPVDLQVKAASELFGTSTTYNITAMPAVSKITLDPAEVFFYTGIEDIQTVKASLEPATVPPVGLTWTAVKNGIVEITPVENGMVSIKPLAAGKTDIAVKEPGGKNAKLTVNVVAPVESVELKANGAATAGGKVKIAVTLAPKNVGNKAVQWSVDVGEDIATINEKGLLTISKTAPSGTKITVTCTALGAPSPVVGTLVVEVP